MFLDKRGDSATLTLWCGLAYFVCQIYQYLYGGLVKYHAILFGMTFKTNEDDETNSQTTIIHLAQGDSKVCLIHTLSGTFIYIHKAGDEIPEELDRESKCLIIKSPNDSDLNIAYNPVKIKKECLNIIEEAWDWYKNHLTISQLLQDSKLINI